MHAHDDDAHCNDDHEARGDNDDDDDDVDADYDGGDDGKNGSHGDDDNHIGILHLFEHW